MSKLTVVSGELSGKVLELGEKEVVVVGRDPGCDFVLDHPDTSRKHAEIRNTPQGFLVKDLGSTNGTKVNGQAITEQLLKNNDEVVFGAVKFKAELPTDGSTRVRSTKVRSVAPTLTGSDGKVHTLGKDVTIVGRESGCDLVIASENVSARHAELRQTPQGLMVKDLGSTNGTFVNGQKITEKLLSDGDEVAFDVNKFKVSASGGQAGTKVRGTQVRPPAGEAAAAPATPAASGGKSMMPLIIGIVVVLVAVGGAAAWYFKAGPGSGGQSLGGSPTQQAMTTSTAAPAQGTSPAQTAAPAVTQAAPKQVIDRLVFNHVWSYTTGDKVFSSPAVGDVNGDGVLDVVVGSNDNMIYLLDGKQGGLHWRFRTDGPVQSSPLLVDLTSDGQLDVVCGTDGGRVYALDGTGRKIWEAPEDLQPGAGNEFQSSPAAAEISGRAPVDVVIGCQNGQVYGLSGDRGWKVWQSGSILKAGAFATPALTDANGDGTADALIGSLDNNFYCISGKNGWKLWQFATKGPIKASAAIGDLDGDNKPEAVVSGTDGTVYALHVADGVELWRYESGVPIESSAELADLNRDGTLDVLVALTNGKLTALNGKNGLRVWEFDMNGAKVVSSPVIYDLNGDGVDDAIIADSAGVVHAVSGTTGWELANFTLNAGVVSSPALADINGDGLLDVIVGVEDNNVVVLTLNVPSAKNAVVWPNFRANKARTGK